jgi:hypothetical protein
MSKPRAIHGFSLLKAAVAKDPPAPELDPSVVKEGWALKVGEHWLNDPSLQAHWNAEAARVNARNGIIPSILRQPTGTQAWRAAGGHMSIWKGMSKEEKAEWYSKEKEPLLQAMIVREMEKLHCVSKFFNGLQGPLENIAIHMVGWEDQIEVDRQAKSTKAKVRYEAKQRAHVAEQLARMAAAADRRALMRAHARRKIAKERRQLEVFPKMRKQLQQLEEEQLEAVKAERRGKALKELERRIGHLETGESWVGRTKDYSIGDWRDYPEESDESEESDE